MGLVSALVRALFGPGPSPDAKSIGTLRTSKPRTDTSRGTFVKHSAPDGMACRYRDVYVAGISYRSDAGSDFVLGTNQRIELEREPTNPKDKNAIKVIGVFEYRGVSRREHIGYVPRDTAARIAERFPETVLAAVPITVFQPDCDHETPGVRFDIFTPRKPRAKKTAAAGKPGI